MRIISFACGLGCAVSVAPPAHKRMRLSSVDADQGVKLRVDDMLTDEQLSLLSPRTHALAVAQPDLDAALDAFTPLMGGEMHENVLGLDSITVGATIGRGRWSTVKAVIGQPRLALKYQLNCEQLNAELHPLLMDYWLGVAAAKVGAAAMPAFVSPAAALPPYNTTAKSDVVASETEWETCRAHGGVIRYMLMERVGECLSVFEKRDTHGPYMSVHLATRVGIQVLSLLKRLHTSGIVHGDIHPGNICQKLNKPGEMTLIDFGTGLFVDAEITHRPVAGSLTWVHPAMSPWQLDGWGYSRRDDIYKLLFTMANLMIGESFWAHPFLRPGANPKDLLEWKLTGCIFQNPYYDPIGAIPALSGKERGAVRDIFRKILRTVTALEPTSRIPYRELSEGFYLISAATQPRTSTMATTTTDTPFSTTE